MQREHRYSVDVVWTGNTGEGTSDYRSYTRDYEIRIAGKPVILGSSDPKFRGDPARYAGIVVLSYEDQAEGTMEETIGGTGRFSRVLLRPHVRVKASVEEAETLHRRANDLCYIANSVNFPVLHEPITELQTP
jgi:organic hydroperoxide reductase OsmC/OhrA